MDSITLENFISFCDDMQIAQEGFKEIGDYVKKVGQRLIQKINELINRITIKARSSNGKCYVPKNIYEYYKNQINYFDSSKMNAVINANNPDHIENEQYKQMIIESQNRIKKYEEDIRKCKEEIEQLKKSKDGKSVGERVSKEIKIKQSKKGIENEYRDFDYEQNAYNKNTIHIYTDYDFKKNLVVIQSSKLINMLKEESKGVMKAIKNNNKFALQVYRYRYETVLLLVQNLFNPF